MSAERESLQVRPDGILPGDVFTLRGGPYAGKKLEAIDVLHGRYATYRVVARVVDPVEVGIDYAQIVNVSRATPSAPNGEER